VILVTGGAKGIGGAIVRAAAAGGIPVIVDREADAVKHLHKEIIVGDVIVADISAAQACNSVITQLKSSAGLTHS
jgi:NAD(P)-dependent dehydrogenase (short-subunit alcohol dehydrogenase family)